MQKISFVIIPFVLFYKVEDNYNVLYKLKKEIYLDKIYRFIYLDRNFKVIKKTLINLKSIITVISQE